jgi:hypothetical protein
MACDDRTVRVEEHDVERAEAVPDLPGDAVGVASDRASERTMTTCSGSSFSANAQPVIDVRAPASPGQA